MAVEDALNEKMSKISHADYFLKYKVLEGESLMKIILEYCVI